MENMGTVIAIVLVILFLILISVLPGIIARLIFRKTDEIKLRNITATILAIACFIKGLLSGEIEERINQFTSSLGSDNLLISLCLYLLDYFVTYLILRFLVDMGIGITDKMLKKKSQPVHGADAVRQGNFEG